VLVENELNPIAGCVLNGLHLFSSGFNPRNIIDSLAKQVMFLNRVTEAWNKVLSGWQINAIFTALDGFPFGPSTGSNWSGDGNTGNPDRPNWNPSFMGPIIEGTPNQWFNPNAFSLEAAGTFGNVGKNVLIGPNESQGLWDPPEWRR
jgi:hypothetical protein